MSQDTPKPAAFGPWVEARQEAPHDLYLEWRAFYAEKVRSWMSLEELRFECGKLLTVDNPSPELLLVHAMHALEECASEFEGQYTDGCPRINIAAAIRALLEERNELAKDAARYRCLSAMATQQADSLGPIFRIDVRRSEPCLFNFDAAVDAALQAENERLRGAWDDAAAIRAMKEQP